MTDSDKFQEIVNRAALKAAGLGIPGSFFPPLDMAGMSYIWIKLIRNLAKASGHKINMIMATKFILSITSGTALYLGGSRLLNMMLHLIPGAGSITAATTNAAFNWIYTLRLGKLLANQFSQPGFNSSMLIISASGIAGLIFALPTSDEISDAFHTIGDALGWHSEADAVASLAGSSGDIVGEAVNSLQDSAHAALPTAHTDLTMSASPHHSMPDADIRFGGSHPVEPSIGSVFSFESLSQMPISEQHEFMNKVAKIAQDYNQPELAANAGLVIDGKMDIASVVQDSYKKLPPKAITALGKIRFGGN